MHYHITTVNTVLVVSIIMYNKIIYPKLFNVLGGGSGNVMLTPLSSVFL